MMSTKDCCYIAYLQKDWGTVKVRFRQGTTTQRFGNYESNEYTYRVPNAWNVESGDLLVVPVGSQEDLKIVRVTAVDATPDMDPENSYPIRWAVATLKTDIGVYECRTAREAEALKVLHQAERAARHRMVMETISIELGQKELYDLQKVLDAPIAKD